MQLIEAQLRQADSLRQAGRHDDAIGCLNNLLQAYPNLPAGHNNLGLLYTTKQDFPRAIACFREAIRLRRDFAEAYCNLGTTLLLLGDSQGGEAAIQEALRIRPDFALAHVNRAAICLRQGDFERGFVEFEWRRIATANRPGAAQIPMWDGRAVVANGSILLHAEHGIGDTIQFVRYAPLVRQRCSQVLLHCEKALVPLLHRCPGIDRFVVRGDTLPPCHFQAPLMSLPLLLRTRLATIPAPVPYVSPDRELASAWGARLRERPGYKVGIAWQGNPRYPTDNLRSIPLGHFRPLAQVPGIALYSLQKGAGVDQLAGHDAALSITSFDDDFDTTAGIFMDTAAVMKNLDLIVTSDTAVAHLAGAMGLPVWVALCKPADWRWLERREDCPWYPTMRLFRQTELGDWESVFERIAGELKAVVDGDRSRLLPQGKPPLEIRAPIGAGELLDRIAILEIKCRRLPESEQLAALRCELEALLAVREQNIPMTADITALFADLRTLNERLWDAETRIRQCEQQGESGPVFVELARTICTTNDERASVKQTINSILHSAVRDAKQYSPAT